MKDDVISSLADVFADASTPPIPSGVKPAAPALKDSQRFLDDSDVADGIAEAPSTRRQLLRAPMRKLRQMMRTAQVSASAVSAATYGEGQDSDNDGAPTVQEALRRRPAKPRKTHARAKSQAKNASAKPITNAAGAKPRPAKPQGAAKTRRKAAKPLTRAFQTKGSVTKNTLKTAPKATKATSRAAGVIKAPMKGAARGTSPLLGAAPIALVLVVVLMSCMSLSFCTTATQERYAGLSDNERIVASYLLAHGTDELHTAAIMGNINAESGFRFDAVEASTGEGHGLCQWSFGRWGQLQSFAASNDASWTTPNIQLDFLWAELTGEGDATPFTSVQYDHAGFTALESLEDAVYYFGRGFERPSEQYAHWERRIAAATRYFAIFTGAAGIGQSLAGASETQIRLVLATTSTAWPGANLCATWVTHVFQTAGLLAPSGDACDMYADWCTSSNRAELKVGMIIATGSTSYSYGGYMGQVYGHVGIYIGDGKVMDSVGAGIGVSDLDTWVTCASPASPARWGWARGVDLSS